LGIARGVEEAARARVWLLARSPRPGLAADAAGRRQVPPGRTTFGARPLCAGGVGRAWREPQTREWRPCRAGARESTCRLSTAPCGKLGSATTTVYLPNITKTLGGPSGWVTPFIVQNIGAQPTVLEVSFFRFADGSLVTCRKVSGLAPGTSFADVPNNDTDLPSDTQFSVVVRSYGAQLVSLVNGQQGLGTLTRAEALSYVGLTSGATR